MEALAVESNTLTTQLAAANTSIQALTADNNSLTAANGQLQTQVNTLTAANSALLLQLSGLQTQTSTLSTTLGTLFNQPGFQIPGTTLTQQVQALSTAIGSLNYGQKQALYFNLGGVKK